MVSSKTNKVIRRHSPWKYVLKIPGFEKIINIFLTMDLVKVLASLDYSIFIFAKLRVSPVRSSPIYLVKRFNRDIYNICAVKKYGRSWFFDCSGICSRTLHGINAIIESPLIENFCFKPTFNSDQPKFWLGCFKYVLCN